MLWAEKSVIDLFHLTFLTSIIKGVHAGTNINFKYKKASAIGIVQNEQQVKGQKHTEF